MDRDPCPRFANGLSITRSQTTHPVCLPFLDFCSLSTTEVPVICTFVHASSWVEGEGRESMKPGCVLGGSYQLEQELLPAG